MMSPGSMRSNRTFMELKCFSGRLPYFPGMRSNRTFMELKWRTRCPCLHGVPCSNRTFMELKLKSNNYIMLAIKF